MEKINIKRFSSLWTNYKFKVELFHHDSDLICLSLRQSDNTLSYCCILISNQLQFPVKKAAIICYSDWDNMVRDWRGEWADMQNSLLFITIETALKNQGSYLPP